MERLANSGVNYLKRRRGEMGTYIVHVSVDAVDAKRAIKIVQECIRCSVEILNYEDGETAVVLSESDVIEE